MAYGLSTKLVSVGITRDEKFDEYLYVDGDAMTQMDHDIDCIALRQLETALCLYREEKDHYSVITLAGAAEELFGSFLLKKLKDALREYFGQEKSNSAIPLTDDLQESINKLQEKFEENDKLCEEIIEKLRNDEEPDNLPGKLLGGRNQEKKLLKDLECIVDEKLERLEESSRVRNDSLKMFLQSLKWIFDSYKPTIDSLADAAVEIGEILDGEAPSRRSVIGAANEIRNILKHGLLDERTVVEFDAPEVAKHMLDRAISNYCSLNGNPTPAMEKFQDMHVKDNAHIRRSSEDDRESCS